MIFNYWHKAIERVAIGSTKLSAENTPCLQTRKPPIIFNAVTTKGLRLTAAEGFIEGTHDIFDVLAIQNKKINSQGER